MAVQSTSPLTTLHATSVCEPPQRPALETHLCASKSLRQTSDKCPFQDQSATPALQRISFLKLLRGAYRSIEFLDKVLEPQLEMWFLPTLTLRGLQLPRIQLEGRGSYSRSLPKRSQCLQRLQTRAHELALWLRQCLCSLRLLCLPATHHSKTRFYSE